MSDEINSNRNLIKLLLKNKWLKRVLYGLSTIFIGSLIGLGTFLLIGGFSNEKVHNERVRQIPFIIKDYKQQDSINCSKNTEQHLNIIKRQDSTDSNVNTIKRDVKNASDNSEMIIMYLSISDPKFNEIVRKYKNNH